MTRFIENFDQLLVGMRYQIGHLLQMKLGRKATDSEVDDAIRCGVVGLCEATVLEFLSKGDVHRFCIALDASGEPVGVGKEHGFCHIITGKDASSVEKTIVVRKCL